MSGSGVSMPDWRRISWVMGAIGNWRSFSGWIFIRWPEGAGNCWQAISTAGAFVAREGDASQPKKKARRNRPHRSFAALRNCRRPHERAKVDSPGHAKHCSALAPPRHPRKRPHGSPLVEADEVLLARNRKMLEAGLKNPPPRRVRNRQFLYIQRQRKQFTARGAPVISVDTKKKELIGRFKNPGERWERHAQAVNDHDFRSDAKGMAIPYGVYDPQRNHGFVAVGTSRETPAFAVDAICLWWQCCGQKHYPEARELLILADSGGGNGARVRAWKYHLQHKLANRYQLSVTVTHYPPGSSKWNPIQHRIFSQSSSNWEATPLTSYELMVNYIRTTETSTGLKVCARLFPKGYQKGETISDPQMRQLLLTRHKTLPGWNYTLTPHKM